MADESILLVEDDPSMRRSIQATLATGGHRVRSSGTCAEGLALALEEMPSLLVLDIGLPDGTGWSLLEGIRRARPGRSPQVIAMSSQRVPRAKIKENGVDRFVSKPFDMAYLADLVKVVLASAS